VLDDTERTLEYYTDETLATKNGSVLLIEVQQVDQNDCHLVLTTPKRRWVLTADDTDTSAEFARALNFRRERMPTMRRRSEWAADKEVSTCALCSRRFTVMFRRHHCRFCGDVMCGDCAPSRTTMALKKKKGVVRCCYECFGELCPEAPHLEKEREVAQARHRHATSPSRVNPYKQEPTPKTTSDDEPEGSGAVESEFVLSGMWGSNLTFLDLKLAVAPYGRIIEVNSVEVGPNDELPGTHIDRDDTCRVLIVERERGVFPTDRSLSVGGHDIGVTRSQPSAPPGLSSVAHTSQLDKRQRPPLVADDTEVTRRLTLVGVPSQATFNEVKLGLAGFGRVDSLNGVGVNFNGLFLGPDGDSGAVGDVPRCGYHEITIVRRKDTLIPDAFNVTIRGATVRVAVWMELSSSAGPTSRASIGSSFDGQPRVPLVSPGVYELEYGESDLTSEYHFSGAVPPTSACDKGPAIDDSSDSSDTGPHEIHRPLSEYHDIAATPASSALGTEAPEGSHNHHDGNPFLSVASGPATPPPKASPPLAPLVPPPALHSPAASDQAPVPHPFTAPMPDSSPGPVAVDASLQPEKFTRQTPAAVAPRSDLAVELSQSQHVGVATKPAPAVSPRPASAVIPPAQQEDDRVVRPRERAAAAMPTPPVAPTTAINHSGSRSKAMNKSSRAMAWCQQMAEGTGIEIRNFSKDFGDGRAFCAIMHGVFPNKVNIASLRPENRAENFELAFRVAEEGGQERFLDVEDCVELPYPDKLAVMTYIFELHRRFGSKS
jgi:hypothetical protein